MMAEVTPGACAVRGVSAELTWPLRHKVLRPHQPLEQSRYQEDDTPEAYHAAAFVREQLLGVASVYHEPRPGTRDPGAWRLRGMAVLEEMRGRGYGMRLLRDCVEHVRQRGGTVLWCNARTSVSGFYSKAGFQVLGEEFELPGLGPHVVMALPLPQPSNRAGENP